MRKLFTDEVVHERSCERQYKSFVHLLDDASTPKSWMSWFIQLYRFNSETFWFSRTRMLHMRAYAFLLKENLHTDLCRVASPCSRRNTTGRWCHWSWLQRRFPPIQSNGKQPSPLGLWKKEKRTWPGKENQWRKTKKEEIKQYKECGLDQERVVVAKRKIVMISWCDIMW